MAAVVSGAQNLSLPLPTSPISSSPVSLWTEHPTVYVDGYSVTPHRIAPLAPPSSSGHHEAGLTSAPLSHSTIEPPLMQRKPNKLRKPPPNAPSAYPLTVLPPLSFIPEPLPPDQHSAHTDSSHDHNLLYIPPSPPLALSPSSPSASSAFTISASSQAPLLPDHDHSLSRKPYNTSRKLTKRRPSLPTIQSGSYGYLITQANFGPDSSVSPATNIDPATVPIPTRTHSDPTAIRMVPAKPPQRRSTLSFSFKGRKRVNAATEAERSPRWSRWRGTASDTGHDTHDDTTTQLLPPVRAVSPFRVSLPVGRTVPHYRRSSPWADSEHFGTSNSGRDTPFGDANGATETSRCHVSSIPASAGRKKTKFTLGGPEHHQDEQGTSSDPNNSSPTTAARPRLPRQNIDDVPAGSGLTEASNSPSWVGRSSRRWTLTMAMNDDGITDEVLVAELERMRIGKADESWSYTLSNAEHGDGGYWRDSGEVYGVPLAGSDDSLHMSSTSFNYIQPATGSNTTTTWHTARRALLTCREIVRTERHYLLAMNSLKGGITKNMPPPLMVRYAGELINVAQSLLTRMEEDPSAWGVAAAFLGAEEHVESAFVAWCGVVGSWFVDEPVGSGRRNGTMTPRRVLSKVKVADIESTREVKPKEDEGTSTKKMGGTWRKSMPSIASMNATYGYNHPLAGLPPSPTIASGFLGRKKEGVKITSSFSSIEEASSGKKVLPGVRELAILPTQRVMRYVLLYADLLAHTPIGSPSRPLVERAAEAAKRIAQKCDRAQGNAAFLQRRP
ncbi:hypothetical protein BD779DRAFT_59670 [Infundibulicybe gibba]|nr:hypothetical protein BD779DRAFT_59670 [Infundibulicybe gibba]